MAGTRLSLIGFTLLLALTSPLASEKRQTAAELTNFSLGADLAQWLVGPVARIASVTERNEFLALKTDEAAADFIEGFWRRREVGKSTWAHEQPRAVFSDRAEEADRLFTEGVRLGRRTHRGEIHVVYGPPKEIRFDQDPDLRLGAIEIWEYDKKAVRGLDGKRPKSMYRFVKQDQSTVFISSARSRISGGR